MNTPFQHGSSSGDEPEPATPHGPPDFLIAQQQLNAVADILATGALQDVGEDRRRDVSASLSAIRALLSPTGSKHSRYGTIRQIQKYSSMALTARQPLSLATRRWR